MAGHSVFVHLRGPTRNGALWRLGPQHVVALLAYFARQWGPIVHCSFPKAEGQGRLLAYGTVSFQDESSVSKVLHAAHQRRGVFRIPFGSEKKNADAIAYARWAEIERAWDVGPSIKERVQETAPLASGAKSADADHFFAKVERKEAALAAPESVPRTAALRRAIKAFDGMAGGMAKNVEQRLAHRGRQRGMGKEIKCSADDI
ncbi:hypothetical protein MVES_001371 [Malassezia vespertilionis]|uniref:RRM domain-containing protein n=1 Tax=Malassezia vespertilionis TaxID=2020962 RepID=A0A2N1JF93_9BASI|nr:hypothetical protein MVES_001371 [Malassezia vespertilionis]